MKTSPLYLGIDFGTTNSSVAYIYADPRHLSARYVPVEPVRITMDAENNLMAERMPSLISTRFDDRRATGLAGGWPRSTHGYLRVCESFDPYIDGRLPRLPLS
jgi:molecular chaperone DnaK (HSP70)